MIFHHKWHTANYFDHLSCNICWQRNTDLSCWSIFAQTPLVVHNDSFIPSLHVDLVLEIEGDEEAKAKTWSKHYARGRFRRCTVISIAGEVVARCRSRTLSQAWRKTCPDLWYALFDLLSDDLTMRFEVSMSALFFFGHNFCSTCLY